MRFGMRKPSLKKSLKARTTGKAKRAIKKAVIPRYGKKGMGWATNPKKAAYNKIYNKTSVGVNDIIKASTKTGAQKNYSGLNTVHKESTYSEPTYYDKTILMCTIFGGWFGLHRYMRKQIGMGLLYTFTVGLFCIGWIVDIIVEATRPKV